MSNLVEREPTALERSQAETVAYLRSHRNLLEAYTDAVWERIEGASSQAIVQRTIAAIDVQLRNLGQPVSPASVLLALWSCLALRLTPHGGPLGYAYLTCFKGDATLIVGVSGWQELLRRCGVTELVSGVVCLDDFVGGVRWAVPDGARAGGLPAEKFGAAPPMHLPMADLHLPEAWSLGYAYAKRDGAWLHPYLLSSAELRTRFKAAKARNRRSYAHKHPAAWVRNQVVLRYARSRRVMDPGTDLAIASGMMGPELAAVAPDAALGAAGELAQLTEGVRREADDVEVENMSPAAVMARES